MEGGTESEPHLLNAYNVLDAAAAITSTDVWAVGYYFDAAGNQLTLAEHYAG